MRSWSRRLLLANCVTDWFTDFGESACMNDWTMYLNGLYVIDRYDVEFCKCAENPWLTFPRPHAHLKKESSKAGNRKSHSLFSFFTLADNVLVQWFNTSSTYSIYYAMDCGDGRRYRAEKHSKDVHHLHHRPCNEQHRENGRLDGRGHEYCSNELLSRRLWCIYQANDGLLDTNNR